MPRGSKAKYTTKQKRKARHIEESYEDRGLRPKEAARRAWATVNKESGGGKQARRVPLTENQMQRGGAEHRLRLSSSTCASQGRLTISRVVRRRPPATPGTG
jgi:hypothetical protein